MPTENVTMTLADLLQALVGCSGIPRGLESGLLIFNHESHKLSYVNTCAPSVTFCRTAHLQKYKYFEETMKDVVFGTIGFGLE